MPYILIVMFWIVQPGAQQSRFDHIDSIRFDDENACKAAWQGLADKLNSMVAPNRADATIVAMNCIPAKS
jgi:hypothetical protein